MSQRGEDRRAAKGSPRYRRALIALFCAGVATFAQVYAPQALLPQIARFWQMVCEDLAPGQRAGRLKQWLNLLRRHYPEAEFAFQELRVQTDQPAITQWVAGLQACAA